MYIYHTTIINFRASLLLQKEILYLLIVMLPNGGQAQCRSVSGWPVLWWVLGFMEKTFYNTDPVGFASTIIKTGDDETKEGLRVEEAPGESPGVLCFGSLDVL